MFSIVKRYCISEGPCNIGDVLEVKPNEHMVKVTAEKKPKTNLLTRGTNSARVAAHNLPFDRRMINAAADDFTFLYVSCEKCPQEFWSITVMKGEKATLKLLTTDQAAKVFTGLPQKLYPSNFLFRPEMYERQVKAVRDANTTLKEAEKERLEQAEWEALGPLGRFGKSPPQGWG